MPTYMGSVPTEDDKDINCLTTMNQQIVNL
jgi:hypothetical protein